MHLCTIIFLIFGSYYPELIKQQIATRIFFFRKVNTKDIYMVSNGSADYVDGWGSINHIYNYRVFWLTGQT